MKPGSDQVNRVRKAKRLVPAFLLRDPTQFHVHPMRKRVPNPYDADDQALT